MAIGQSKQRLDAEAKVTGRARYTDDMGLPGMRHAAYVHSTIAHGMVLSIDASEALALPGVEAVFTADDVPGFLFPTAGHPYSMDPSHGDVADRLLLTKHVRYYGDEVAVVVARDGLTARKAAHLVKVEYEPLPVMTSAETALAPGAPVLQPSVNPDGNLLKQHTLECNGTLDEALAAADVVVEGAYRTPTMQHCHLENQTAYAYMDDMRHIVIVSSTQIPHICRRVVGQALGIPWSSVRVIKPYIGGGFGNKQDVVLEPIVAFLTMKLDGAPVSMELTREECMLCTRVRHAFAMTARAGATKDGKLLGYGLDVLSNTGAYASHGHSIAAAGGSKVCYVYPHATYRFSAKTFYSNIPVGGACRGYGSPQTAYAIECLMDDTARALGMDPLDFRLKNTGRNGDISPLNGKPVATLGISDCLEEGRKKFRWDERKAACKAFNEEAVRTGSPLRRGVGVSAFSYGSGTYPANVEPGSARLILNQDGTVNLMTGATEIGQGADTAFAQMVSETLGVAYENILTMKLDGAPVSMELTREECMLCTRVRHAFAMTARAGATKDGKLLGYGLDVLSNTGAYASHGHSIAAAGGSKVCYVYPHATYRFSAKTFYSNIPVGGACRGYGSPQTAYAIECLMDDTARALGMDPLDFRLKNTGRNGDISPLNGKPVATLGISDCLEEGRKKFRWDERKAACKAFNEEAVRTGSPLRRGVGVSAFSYGSGTYPANVEPGSARLILNQDGTVNLMTGATEIGQGADTAFAQMVSETLGVAYENIHVISTQDTDITPWDPGAYASRQTYTCAPAVHAVADGLRRKLLGYAAEMTGHTPAALTIAPTAQGDAVVFVRNPESVVVTLHDLAMDSFYNKDRGGQLSAEASFKTRQNPPSFGGCFAEVEVDIDLCKVRITHILNVHDAGVIINPALATAQVHGGMGMGIGWALYEELLVDPATGRVHNNNLLDYKFPTTCDIPDLACAFVETQEPSGVYGNKSLGEPPLISPAPALRNAVLDATGVAVNAIPMTPKLLFEEFVKAGLIKG